MSMMLLSQKKRLAWLPEEVEAIKDLYKDAPFDAQEIALDALGLPIWGEQ